MRCSFSKKLFCLNLSTGQAFYFSAFQAPASPFFDLPFFPHFFRQVMEAFLKLFSGDRSPLQKGLQQGFLPEVELMLLFFPGKRCPFRLFRSRFQAEVKQGGLAFVDDPEFIQAGEVCVSAGIVQDRV